MTRLRTTPARGSRHKPSDELTLWDRLSRLTHKQACTLLGASGEALLRAGGSWEVDLDQQVQLASHEFRLTLPSASGAGDRADIAVSLRLEADRRSRLAISCSACASACEHQGAALALILEEKSLLGLAAPPDDSTPLEWLDPAALIERALTERLERARTERMRVRSLDGDQPWTDYLVTSFGSGRTYRVALRSFERGESYCSCPDLRKNALGTCKHLLHVIDKVKRRFSAAKLRQPYRREGFSVHLRYAKDAELRLAEPADIAPAMRALVAPLLGRPITDISELLRLLRALEQRQLPVTVYPDAEAYIQQELRAGQLARVAAEIRRDPSTHPLRQTLLREPLLPYQLEGIACAAQAGRMLLADEMGLGKTVQAIGLAELLAREVGIERVLVICPASVKAQWRAEALRFAGRSAQLVGGTSSARHEQYREPVFFTICNYEQVLRDTMAIEAVAWDLIVLDEGQRIKNWEAKTSAVIKSLRSPFALVLSGTPLENRLEELYSVVEFIDERRLGPAFRFLHQHRVVSETGKVLGYKDLDQLRERLRGVMLRRTRAEVMKQLPPRTTEVVRIPPTDEQRAYHATHIRVASSIARKKYISEMDLLRLQRALLMCRLAANGTYLVDKEPPGFSSKLEYLDELFARLAGEPSRKAVLFSEWTTMLDLVAQRLDRHGLTHVRLDGSVPQKQRQQLVSTFQKNPSCRFFITTNAGATGLNLQAANTVINVDLPWNPAVLEQRIARAHRMGQKEAVHVFVLVTEETLEENLLTTLAAKHDLALAALDVDSQVDRVDLVSNMEELRRRLEVLLGARQAAPIDASEQRAREHEAERLRQAQLAEAGGRLLVAAFDFLGHLLPEAAPATAPNDLTQRLKAQLAACVQPGEDGKPKLILALPDTSALDNLATLMGRVLAAGPQPP